MKHLMPILLFAVISASAEDEVFLFHDSFRFLLEETQELASISEALASLSASGTSQIEVVMVHETKASCDLLLISTKHLLLQHGAQVDAYGKTRYYNQEKTIAAVKILVQLADQTLDRCDRISKYTLRPSLETKVKALQQIAGTITLRLSSLIPEDETIEVDKAG